MASVTVLMVSMGNLPTATAGSQPATGTLTIGLFCDTTVVAQSTTFGSVNPGEQDIQGSFDLQQNVLANGNDVFTIQSDGWFTGAGETPPNAPLIAAADTSFGFDVPVTTVFDNTVQALGTVEPNTAADRVNLEFDVNLVGAQANFIGAGVWNIALVASCNTP